MWNLWKIICYDGGNVSVLGVGSSTPPPPQPPLLPPWPDNNDHQHHHSHHQPPHNHQHQTNKFNLIHLSDQVNQVLSYSSTFFCDHRSTRFVLFSHNFDASIVFFDIAKLNSKFNFNFSLSFELSLSLLSNVRTTHPTTQPYKYISKLYLGSI